MGRKVAVCLSLALAAVLLVAGLPVAFAEPGRQSSSPAITLSPATALPNQSITVTGKNFTTGGNASISSITIGGILTSTEKINFGSPVQVDNSGNFVANLIVPINSTTLKAGAYSVAVTDSAGVKASASLTIATSTLTVSPASSRVGSVVTLTGTNFPVSSGSIGADQSPLLTIEYEARVGAFRAAATVFTDSSGGFTTTFTVPLNVAVPSADNIIRVLVEGIQTGVTAKHSVPSPTLTLSPAKGAPGTSVTLTGSDFRAFASVTSLGLGGLDVGVAANLHTDANGGFTTTFIVPNIYGGAQPVLAQVGGFNYTAVFQVEASSTQLGESQSLLPWTIDLADALEPLGDNLVRVFYFDNATKGWSFYDPRPGFARANTLTRLVEGQAYWVEVKSDQTAILYRKTYTLVEGWNLIPWQE